MVTSESDWVGRTSVGCTAGDNSLAQNILQKLFKGTVVEATSRKMTRRKKFGKITGWLPNASPFPDLSPSTDDCPSAEECPSPALTKPENDYLLIKKINGRYSFDNFDESQHVNGCPLKWFYNKKQAEKDKRYKVERRCSRRSAKKEPAKGEKKKNTRDRMPVDVKIHKINLLEKYGDSGVPPLNKWSHVGNSKDAQRKNLAAKLNWKFHDIPADEDSLSDVFSTGNRQDYLPPRPLMGLKPLLTILLFPNQETNCCSTKIHFQSSAIKDNSTISPTLSIKSLDLPILNNEIRPPKPIHVQRWGSKSCKLQKKLQIPHQVTINLRHTSRPQSNSVGDRASVLPPASAPLTTARTQRNDKSNSRSRDRSLSTLVYELSDKTSYRNESNEGFEDLIREITIDDEDSMQRKRFFRHESACSRHFDETKTRTRRRDFFDMPKELDDELNLTCGKVRIFEKLPKKRK